MRRPYPSPLFFAYSFVPGNNHVRWTETPDSHVFSVVLPGVRKEEIRVEVEDSTYMSIRTVVVEGEPEPARKFSRKFRLPAMVDVYGISAGYEDGVLTVRVPRVFVRRGFFIDPSDLPPSTTTQALDTARAA
ncbi:hypothetical protein MLD38_027484 [Melastoma candidum]|uniref:Uncharacterized protein n=1 Tax=Melastoma candidum TaxID=119954 RepID=A0ACB9P3I1_9MYRT|nr:hypothetical protein MLD38_027484 [Melastoma candidum]